MQTVSLEDFTLQERIGGGGFAIIKKGLWKKTNKTVALKMLFDPNNSKSNKAAFQNELDFLQRCSSQYIVQLIAQSSQEGDMFFVLEICKTNLHQVLHQENHPPRSYIKILMQVIQGILYLHEQTPPIIHRDLKPQNMLLDYKGNCKLCDFGIAMFQNQEGCKSCGTISYMAPEMFRNASITTSVDIFAFGVSLWETQTKIIPFGHFNSRKDIQKYLSDGKRLSLDFSVFLVNEKLENLVASCWKQDSSSRPTAAEVLNELQFLSNKTGMT